MTKSKEAKARRKESGPFQASSDFTHEVPSKTGRGTLTPSFRTF